MVLALTGCASTRLRAEVIGVFRNKSGHQLIINPKGEVYEAGSSAAALSFVGIASSEKANPGRVLITTPSVGTQWMGTTLVFSADFARFDVFGYEPRPQFTKPPVVPR